MAADDTRTTHRLLDVLELRTDRKTKRVTDSNESLAVWCGCSARTVQRHLKVLKDSGRIDVHYLQPELGGDPARLIEVLHDLRLFEEPEMTHKSRASNAFKGNIESKLVPL